MFIKTMAVGPLDSAEFCVTGGLCIDARHLADCAALFGRMSGGAVCREMPLESPATDCRKAMATGASVESSDVPGNLGTLIKVETKNLEDVRAQRTVRRQLQRVLKGE